MTELHELRSYERYVLGEPLVGSYGSAEVTVIDLGEQGAQIEHAHPLRVGTTARFWFKRGEIAVSSQALVVWSRLSRHKSPDGKLLYRTGLRIEEAIADFTNALALLLEKDLIHRDSQSMERKRKLREERELARSAGPTMRMVRIDDDIPSHQALLVEHARERLKANPDEAQKWYSRAYYAIRQGQSPLVAELTKYREDVLAVWEYLERSVPLSVIARVFEKKP